MFYNCSNLEKLDVSNLNTENSESFKGMFHGCSKLKEINVSNFKTYNCTDISCMFKYCESLLSIDMLNWDMRNIDMNGMRDLFFDCSNLNKIKINFNTENRVVQRSFENINICFKKEVYAFPHKSVITFHLLKQDFYGLPENGIFIWRKGINCNELLKLLPVSWNRYQE